MGFFSSCLPVPEISGDWIHKDLFSSVFLYCKWQLSSLLLLELFCALMVLFPSLKSTNFISAEHGGNETERQQYLSHLILRVRICLIQFSLTKQTEKTIGKAWGKDVATKQVWFGHTAYLLDILHFSRRMSPGEPTMAHYWPTSCLNASYQYPQGCELLFWIPQNTWTNKWEIFENRIRRRIVNPVVSQKQILDFKRSWYLKE